MMVWFGSHWTFWQSGLMSIAILVFWLLVAGCLRLHYLRAAQDAHP